MIKNPLFPFLLILLSPFLVIAQSIRGEIRDSQTREPLAGITVSVSNTSVGTITQADGRFALSGLSDGIYTLRISAVGYETLQRDVQVPTEEKLVYSLKKAIVFLNNEVNVTAQRFENQSFHTPQSVSVLSSAYIRQTAPRSTPELLTGTTGVFVQKTNHGGGSPIIRGLMGNQVLLMMDGIRLNNATYRYGPNQYLATIDPLMLERLEVTRGTGSVLYGSDALGGVVQLISKTPTFASGKPTISASGYGKWMSAGMELTGRGEVAISTDNLAFVGGFSAKNFGDLLAGGNLGFQRPSAYQEQAGDAKLLIKTSSSSIFTASYQHVYQYDVPIYYRITQDNYLRYSFVPQTRTLGYLRWEKSTSNKWMQAIRVTGSLNRSVEGLSTQRNNATTRSKGKDVVNTWGAIAEVHSQPATFWQIQSGVEYYLDQVSSEASTVTIQTDDQTARRGNFADGSLMQNLAVFTSHVLDFNRFQLTGGLRFTAVTLQIRDEAINSPTIRPSALVGNLSATYTLHANHHLIFVTNTGFRAPNLDDVSKLGNVEANVFETPNTNLSPEKTMTIEGGYKFRTHRFSGSVMAYRTNLTDQIIRVKSVLGGDTLYQGVRVYTKTNSSRSLLYGGEAEAEVQLISSLVAFGNITYVYGQDKSRNEPMRRLPPLFGRAGLRMEYKGFSGRVEYIFADKQDRLAGGDQSDVRISSRLVDGATPAWNVVNLYAGYSYRTIILNLGIQNLFDKAYRTHGSGVDGVGRSLWVALRYQIGKTL